MLIIFLCSPKELGYTREKGNVRLSPIKASLRGAL